MPSIENPAHKIDFETMAVIEQQRHAESLERERADELAELGRPSQEERRLLLRLKETEARSRGVDFELTEQIRESRRQRFDQFEERLKRDNQHAIDLLPSPPPPPFAEPVDSTFWAANTYWHHHRSFRAGLRDDGVHFYAGITCHDGDLHKASFGVEALFEVGKDRIPPSPSSRWLSAPYVEVFGALLGKTGDDDIFTGDLWSKCWMHRRQSVFQLGFGQDGPTPIILGEASRSEELIFEENGDRSVLVGLPGLKWIPAVIVQNINPVSSLFSRVAVRFDIQVEGAGSLLWAHPKVVIHTLQWPLKPH